MGLLRHIVGEKATCGTSLARCHTRVGVGRALARDHGDADGVTGGYSQVQRV